MEPYSSISIGDNPFGQSVALPSDLRDGGVLHFDESMAIGWFGASSHGMKLYNGAYWGTCPDCDEECIYTAKGTPTGVHRSLKAGDEFD